MYPFRFFGIQTGVLILFLSIVMLGSTLLVIGIFSLVSAFSYLLTGLTRVINTVTSLLAVLTAIIILFFQMVITGQHWLHVLFGIGLLSYAIGRIGVGAFAGEYDSGLRVFIVLLGSTIAVFSIIVAAFQFVRIRSDFYYTYLYFVNITIILIGAECLGSGVLSMLMKRSTVAVDKEEPEIEISSRPIES
jgi:hypothetical protein